MAKSELAEYKERVAAQLSTLGPLLQKYALGDFSQTIEVPEEENEFTELLVGLSLMAEDMRTMVEEKEQRISELEEVHEALRESESKYKTLVENIPQRIFVKDRKSIYVSCNRNYAEDLGITVDEIAGKTDHDFYPKELANGYQSDDQRVMESGETEEIEEQYIQDGQDAWVHTVKTPVRDEEGQVVGILGVFWNITERKQTEKARNEQWARFLTIIDNFPEILYVTDPQTNEVVFVNEVFEKALGSDPVGKKCYEAFQGFDAPCDFCTNDIILEERKPYTWEYHNPLLDKYYRITDQIIEWPDGRDMRFEVALDITERRRAEEQLREHRDNLEELVEQRTAELRRQSEVISQQAQEILEISTPVMQVWDGVVVAPLIGTLDSERTQRFMEVLLHRIVETQSPVALVDITAVPTIDTQTAYHLLETISAVRLLGAQVVLTGVSPAIAQSLVHLGIDLSDIITRSSLAAGLRVALDMPGQRGGDRSKANLGWDRRWNE